MRIPRSQIADRIAVDQAGNVFAAIVLPRKADNRAVGVVKLDRMDGAERWRQRLRGGGKERSDTIYDLATEVGGDVVPVGSLEDEGYNTFFVARLSGHDGAPRWRVAVHGLQDRYFEEARAVTIDGNGDVVAAGMLEGATTVQYHATDDFAVVKLAGVSGAERWRFLLDGSADSYDRADAVAVDSAGDVVATGTLCEAEPLQPGGCDEVVTTVKLAGRDGHLIWRRAVPAWRVSALALDADGNALIAVSTKGPGNDFGVFKLAAATGGPLWEVHVSGSATGWEEAFRVGILPSGDVAASGFTVDDSGRQSLTVVAFDGATGAERWRRLIGPSRIRGLGKALAVTPRGDVAVGGWVGNRHECYDIAFVRLRGETGDVAAARRVHSPSPRSESGAAVCDDGPHDGTCGQPPLGIYEEELTALAPDPHGRLVVAGMLANVPCGQRQGFVAAVSIGRR